MNASSAITHGGRKGLALGIANGDLIAHTPRGPSAPYRHGARPP